MTVENNVGTRLNNVINKMRELANKMDTDDISVIEGLVYHIKRRSEVVESMKNKPGIYVTREEANAALGRRVQQLPHADNPDRNAI